MLKDLLEITLNTAADVAKSYAEDKFNKATPADKRRLLWVMSVAVFIGFAVIVIVVVKA